MKFFSHVQSHVRDSLLLIFCLIKFDFSYNDLVFHFIFYFIFIPYPGVPHTCVTSTQEMKIEEFVHVKVSKSLIFLRVAHKRSKEKMTNARVLDTTFLMTETQ